MDKKLKIAVFHDLAASGAIKALQNNLSFLKSEGHHIDIYTLDTSNKTFAPLDDVSDNVFVYNIKRGRFRKFFFNSLNKIVPPINIPDSSQVYINFNDYKQAQKDIAECINSKDYDIVVSDQEDTFTVSPAFLQYVKKPMVYYCHQPFRKNEKILMKLNTPDMSFFSRLYFKYSQKYINLDIEYAQFANHILTNSYFSHELLLRVYGMNSQVSYLGVDTEVFYPQNLPRKDYVLSVGVMSSHKGYDFIIRALSKIDEDIRPKLVISSYYTNEKWKPHIINLAREKNVSLEILEKISYEELAKVYNEAKLFVFAPYLEAFGLVSLEALACGTPVVGVKEGGVREIVQHGVNGFLSDRNEKTFARYVEELLTNQELWDKFSENGPNCINDFWTLGHSGRRFENHIYRVLEEEKEKDI